MIILDDLHYQSTVEQIAELEAGQIEARAGQGGEEWKRRLEEDSYDSLITELRAQLREYDELRSGTVRSFIASSFLKLPEILVKARIARGLSYKDLAGLLHTSEERVRDWELNDYQTATFVEMAEVITILEIDFSCHANLRADGSANRRPPHRRTQPFDHEEPLLTRSG